MPNKTLCELLVLEENGRQRDTAALPSPECVNRRLRMHGDPVAVLSAQTSLARRWPRDGSGLAFMVRYVAGTDDVWAPPSQLPKLAAGARSVGPPSPPRRIGRPVRAAGATVAKRL